MLRIYLLVCIIIGTVVGAVLALIRVISNQRAVESVRNAKHTIGDNPDSARRIANSLTCFVGKIELPEGRNPLQAIDLLRDDSDLHPFKIHAVKDASPNNWLIVTIHKDVNSDPGLSQIATSTELSQINYRITYKPEQSQLSFYSEQYTNREEERMLKSFRKVFYELIEPYYS